MAIRTSPRGSQAPNAAVEEGLHGFLRRGAGQDQIARLDPAYAKLPLELERPLQSLPVDDEPWLGGLLPLACYCRLTKRMESCLFFFWATAGGLLGVDDVGEYEPWEAGGSLMDTMYAPRIGGPRRPAVIITTPLVALMLRGAGESPLGVAVDELMKVDIGRVDEACGRVRARLVAAVGAALPSKVDRPAAPAAPPRRRRA